MYKISAAVVSAVALAYLLHYCKLTPWPLAGQLTVLTSSHLHQLHLADKYVNTHAAKSTCSTQVQANQTNSSTILRASKILQKSTKVHKKISKIVDESVAFSVKKTFLGDF